MRYYKRKNEDSWHWCPNCENFPVDSDEIIIESEQCEEKECEMCHKLKDDDNCITFEPILEILFLCCVKNYLQKTKKDAVEDQERIINMIRCFQLALEQETKRLSDEESEHSKKYDEWLANREKIIRCIRNRLETIERGQDEPGETSL